MIGAVEDSDIDERQRSSYFATLNTMIEGDALGESTMTVDLAETSTIPDTQQEKQICQIFGDPHVFAFPDEERSAGLYWCRMSGEHVLLRNEHVEIVVNIQNGTWLIDKVQSLTKRISR